MRTFANFTAREMTGIGADAALPAGLLVHDAVPAGYAAPAEA